MLLLLGQLWIETSADDFRDGEVDPMLYISRRLQVEGTDPADSGAIEFYSRFDLDGDGYYDLLGGTEGTALYVFYGTPEGYATSGDLPARADTFPVSSLGNSDIADLNQDGYPELVHSGYKTGVCRIYWGTPSGPDPSTYTDLPNDSAEAVFVYDLDRDGYLDIVLAGTGDKILVYWGEGTDSATMYDPTRVSSLGMSETMAHNIEISDLNKDGFPDIVVALHDSRALGVVWGDGDRDLTNNDIWVSTALAFGHTHGITLGDFNGDEWLDIVVSGYAGSLAYPTVESSYVYWNNQGSFSDANRTLLATGDCYGGSAAYDFNGDGLLDLIFFKSGDASSWLVSAPMKVYFNTGSPPYFTEDQSQELGILDARSGGTVADFNWDGKPDVFTNSAPQGGFLYDCVYWGIHLDTNGVLVYDSLEKISSPNDHHGTFREPGNVYDRSTSAYYISGIFSFTSWPHQAIRLSWVSYEDSANGAVISLEARVSEDSSTWSNWFPTPNGEVVAAPFPFKFAQYRAVLHWSNPAVLPWLERITIEFLNPLVADEGNSGERFQVLSGKGFLWVSVSSGKVALYDAAGRQLQVISAPGSFKLALGPGVYFVSHEGRVVKALVR